MKKIFKSKIGLEFVIPIIILFGVLLFFFFRDSLMLVGIAVILPSCVFLIYLFLSTFYIVENEKLTIKCGFLYNKLIDIARIRSISKTNNPESSPATSIDRLEIVYNKNDRVIISPKDKKGFIESIRMINPGIEVRN